VERKRTALTYDYASSGLDYAAGTEHLIGGTHTVLGTDEEVRSWLE
jgi:oligopeptide transport system ATP-binding protein